jgi:hypothetical protein
MTVSGQYSQLVLKVVGYKDDYQAADSHQLLCGNVTIKSKQQTLH